MQNFLNQCSAWPMFATLLILQKRTFYSSSKNLCCIITAPVMIVPKTSTFLACQCLCPKPVFSKSSSVLMQFSNPVYLSISTVFLLMSHRTTVSLLGRFLAHRFTTFNCLICWFPYRQYHSDINNESSGFRWKSLRFSLFEKVAMVVISNSFWIIMKQIHIWLLSVLNPYINELICVEA